MTASHRRKGLAGPSVFAQRPMGVGHREEVDPGGGIRPETFTLEVRVLAACAC